MKILSQYAEILVQLLILEWKVKTPLQEKELDPFSLLYLP